MEYIGLSRRKEGWRVRSGKENGRKGESPGHLQRRTQVGGSDPGFNGAEKLSITIHENKNGPKDYAIFSGKRVTTSVNNLRDQDDHKARHHPVTVGGVTMEKGKRQSAFKRER